MRSSFSILLGAAAASAVLAIVPAAAPAQEIGDVLGTTGLIGILGGLNLPQIKPPTVPDPNGPTQDETNTPAPTAPAAPETTPPTTHANGYYCKGESRKHVKGQKGTPFSQCVTAMAKLSKGSSTSAAAACRGLSRKHTAGAHGTPYSVCIVGGKKLLADKSN